MVNFAELGVAFGEIFINPHLNLALPVYSNHVRRNFEITSFLKHFLVSLESRLHHVQALLEGDLDQLDEPKMDPLEVDGGGVEGGAHALLAGLLDVHRVDHAGVLLAVVVGLEVGQVLGLAVEEQLVLFYLQAAVIPVGVDREVAVVGGVLEAGEGLPLHRLPVPGLEHVGLGQSGVCCAHPEVA